MTAAEGRPTAFRGKRLIWLGPEFIGVINEPTRESKQVRRLLLLDHDMPGFWETYGYHIYGDPWREQRYSGY
jgi:hypothetical protein